MVVLSDTYYPGWVERVDGRNASIERVHDALRGIAVESGSHTVILTYEPASFRWGVFGSVLGIIAVVVVLIKFFFVPQ